MIINKKIREWINRIETKRTVNQINKRVCFSKRKSVDWQILKPVWEEEVENKWMKLDSKVYHCLRLYWNPDIIREYFENLHTKKMLENLEEILKLKL